MIATTTTQPTPFVWNEIALSEVVLIDGAPHTTRRAIGEWLEYADPQKAIDKLLERNTHIQIHGIPVKLTGMGGARDYETEVFHPIGFLLIVMESGQPRAHEMKAAVAEFVWSFVTPHRLNFREMDALIKRRADLRRELAGCTEPGAAQDAYSDYLQLSALLNSAAAPMACLAPCLRQKALPGV